MMKAQAQQSEKTASPHRSFLAPQRRFVPDALRPRGDPIQAAPRAFTDPQLGHDFSQVRVYPNAQAYEYALAINAPPSALNSDDEQETQRVDNLNRRSNVNRASQESLSMVEHHRYPFSATIPRVAKSRFSHGKGKYALSEKPAPTLQFSLRHNDAMPGNEQTSPIDFAALLAQTTVSTPAEAISEPEEGETIRLPDIVLAPTAATEETDAIASTLGYNPSIAQSGASPGPGNFGVTRWGTYAMSGISVTHAPTTYTITATIDHPVTFQVHATTGPAGQVDIDSDSDSDITQANYPTVASDLTPNMADLNGRPPRTLFWARDLCIRHERFHAHERVTTSQSGVPLAQTWLNTQAAASVADVSTLLAQVPARVAATSQAAMPYPAKEERAYGDGAPLYLARANAIKTKGAAGGYTGPSRGVKTAIGVGGGALVGAGIGFLAGGPVGAAVGAGVGALVGGVGSLLF